MYLFTITDRFSDYEITQTAITFDI